LFCRIFISLLLISWMHGCFFPSFTELDLVQYRVLLKQGEHHESCGNLDWSCCKSLSLLSQLPPSFYFFVFFVFIFFKPFYKFMLFSSILQNLRIGGLESCLICNVMLFKP
jgi:hypothetical protein